MAPFVVCKCKRCLNRTFYGIETRQNGRAIEINCSLNRTFYGIETFPEEGRFHREPVLIVPFMELKLLTNWRQGTATSAVLIVPFMELKLAYRTADTQKQMS